MAECLECGITFFNDRVKSAIYGLCDKCFFIDYPKSNMENKGRTSDKYGADDQASMYYTRDSYRRDKQ